VRLKTSPPSMIRLYRHCRILHIIKSYGPQGCVTVIALLSYMYMFVPHMNHMPPLSVTGIVLFFICRSCSYLTGNTFAGLHGLLRGSSTYLYVDDVHSSQETHLRASAASYEDSFTSLYVNNIRTSQVTHLWASTACYSVFSCLALPMATSNFSP
jgi:hypothetical protein